jgi:hypothetical protein
LIPGFTYHVTTYYLEYVLEMTDYNMFSSLNCLDRSPSTQSILTEDMIKKMTS